MNVIQTADRVVRVLALLAVAAGSIVSGVHAQTTGSSQTPDRAAQAAKKGATNAPPKKAPAKKDPQSVLFLTPGGRYTEADIKANGRKTVAQKYPDFMSEHDAKPKRGQRVCPITDTKANPKLTWVVGGKTYQFCCPPCVTEFVRKAKTNPKAIKDPTAYVKK